VRTAAIVTIACLAGPAAADDPPLATPLTVGDVVRTASARRLEVAAARARARAAAERPAIVAALDDPEVFASIDHLPFMGGGADLSLVIEQRFPLSGIRSRCTRRWRWSAPDRPTRWPTARAGW
jgi:hypothetical protein